MSKSRFYEEVKSAIIEREVEDTYNKGINLYFPGVNITHPFACDGLIDTKTDGGKLLKLIIEYKLDEELINRVSRAKVLIQVIYYIKRFEQEGMILPNVCMVGDINECFVIHTNCLLNYLDRQGVDWSIAPSEAHKYNADFVLDIANDENINPFIFEINENFSFKEVADKIKDLADNVQRYVRVTEHNIANIFDYFVRNVIKNPKKISAHDLVSVFIGVINDKENYYQHPSKQNILVCNGKNVDINGAGFKSFFSYFDRTYTPQEKMKFTEIADRLIEDTERRNNGDFWTPTPFVDYAHKMICEQLGEDWKEKYVVWDNCSGTKNLTRDYKFKELYCSTLFQSELDMAERYNPEATSFQFDFLNDSLDKLPQGLKDALEQNKPIVFLMNPPYASATNRNETSKEGVAKTTVNEQMLSDKVGASSQNLYAQFLYRILLIKRQYNLTNIYIGLYSPTLFLSGSSWKGFRSHFLSEFDFNCGVQFRASHFADVADNWGISFSIWNCGECKNKNDFKYKLIDLIDSEIEIVGEKLVYNIDNQKSLSDWAKEPVKKLKTHDVVNLSSAICVRDKENNRGTNFDNALGFINNGGNNVEQNMQMVSILTTAYGNGNGHGINGDNFERCNCLCAARKLVFADWVNSKDEYLAPNEAHPRYNEFKLDSLVFSLFHSGAGQASNQSSLRQVEYKEKLWDIKNEFFWMSRYEMIQLANDNNNDFCYSDARTSEDRYVYKYIKEHNGEFSDEAQSVLDKACDLVRKSFKYRALFDEEHLEYQINNWDCGWYQIKALVKEYLPDDYKAFQELYKKLADKMRPMVYELGFLK